MSVIIKSVIAGSPASKTSISQGDTLKRINGKIISDILDYIYYTYDNSLLLEIESKDSSLKFVRLQKKIGEDIGLEFDSMLMDTERSCVNHCVFCFIDQLPTGMRDSLYYKDDDMRLSFLQGNYVTLTNLSQREIDRMIKMRISPINVSIHSLDPKIRAQMLGIKNATPGIEALKSLADAGTILNCQIVCCPGINDREELRKTIEGLYALGRSIKSVSIVPVGLTKHRERLFPLQPFDRKLAIETIELVDDFAAKCLKERGSSVFYCADELYINAGKELPPDDYYEDYPQLNNGVGMMRLFVTEFEEALLGTMECSAVMGRREAAKKAWRKTPENRECKQPFSIVTGMAAGEYLTNLLKMASDAHDIIKGDVYTVRNRFFGDSVTVSGLITGGDIIDALKDCDLGSRLLIPKNMLRFGDDVFLDDVTVSEVSDALGVQVVAIDTSGTDLLNVIMGEQTAITNRRVH